MQNQISSGDNEKPSKILTPRINPRSIKTDNSLEFMRACKELNWNHERSSPRRSETKEIAERAVRRVKEGTSPVLVQSGLQESWLAEAMECYCYLRNLQDLPAEGQTPYERRMTAAIHCCLPSGDDLRQEFEETSSEEERKARDPSPDPTARQDFWCIMKIVRGLCIATVQYSSFCVGAGVLLLGAWRMMTRIKEMKKSEKV